MNKKMATLFASTLIALSITGVAFGLWYKVLYVEGYVDTGDLDAAFLPDLRFVEFYYGDPQMPCPPHKVDMIQVTAFPGLEDDQILDVEIIDLYPCITVRIPFTILNDGTVPWVVNEVRLLDVGFPGTVVFPELVGTQVDPDDTVQGYLDVHITNEAAENSEYRFSIEIYCVQWNEYPFTPPYSVVLQ